MADWASSGSAIRASHSIGSRFEVATVAGTRFAANVQTRADNPFVYAGQTCDT